MAEPKILCDRRVLIVEDIARFREMLARAIREMEFEPRPVESAELAIELLESEPVEIAMVDLGLPGMPGLELRQHLRTHHPAVQIIILTGFGDLEAAKQAIRLDVVDFLTKPCDLGELEVALDRALRRFASAGDHAAATDTPPELDVGTQQQEQTIEALERQHIREALKRNNGNRAKTAQELGISVRTLYYRISRYKMQDEFKQHRGL